MKKTLTLLTNLSLVCAFSAHANNPTFNVDDGRLHMPIVDVISGGQTTVYEVDMQRIVDPFKITFEVASYKPATAGGSILKRVRDSKTVTCGGTTDLPGFAEYCKGRECGFFTDLCKAVAAAVFNSPTAPITFVDVPIEKRREVLVNSTVDILSRETTWTTSREADWGHFTWIMFYDGQGFMVRKSSNINTPQDLCGKSVCVVKQEGGTTTWENLKDFFKRLNCSYTTVEADDNPKAFSDYDQGKCEAVTTDRSGLAARRFSLSDPASHKILDLTISKEPLTAAVPAGDEQWMDIVRVVLMVLINAEELGVGQANIDSDEIKNSTNPQVRRLLGIEGDFGQKALGLEPTAFANAIRAIGNYGELYNKYLGPEGIDIPRGPNNLWNNGGLLYAPPIR